jgi:hypothetical protein
MLSEESSQALVLISRRASRTEEFFARDFPAIYKYGSQKIIFFCVVHAVHNLKLRFPEFSEVLNSETSGFSEVLKSETSVTYIYITYIYMYM